MCEGEAPRMATVIKGAGTGDDVSWGAPEAVGSAHSGSGLVPAMAQEGCQEAMTAECLS